MFWKKRKRDETVVPYSYLIDNIKVLLIFLVVFNHIIAFRLVKVDVVVQYIWYAITIFHMPAFVFISGYLSKKPQSVMKNVKNLLIPYILGYTLTWYSHIWIGRSMDYELLRPSGTVMWYVLALFVYRLTIEALGKIRCIVPISIIIALWAGTRPEFTTYLSSSRIVVFFPFFVAGYLWKSDYIRAVRKFKGKWVLIPISAFLLYAIPNYMISNNMPVDIFRGNHSYEVCGLDTADGVIIRLLMYLVSFIVIYTMMALLPQMKLPFTYIGRNTMGIYFFHYPIMILMNGLFILQIPQLLNVWSLLGVSVIFLLVLGSMPVDWLYTSILNLIGFLIFKKDRTVADEGLEEEYDSDEDQFEQLRRRRAVIDELADTLKKPDLEKEQIDMEVPELEPDIFEGEPEEQYQEEIEEDNVNPEQEKEFLEEEVRSLEELIRELEMTTNRMQMDSEDDRI